MAHRTIDDDEAPDYAECEWRMWLNGAAPTELTMLPLMECLRSEEPEKRAGLVRHLSALSDETDAKGQSLDRVGFCAVVDKACADAISLGSTRLSAGDSEKLVASDHRIVARIQLQPF